MKILKTANFKKFEAYNDQYGSSEPYEDWSPEKEQSKYDDTANDASKDAVLNYIKNEIVPEARQQHEEQIKPRVGETLELYMQRRVYIIENQLKKLIELDAPQQIIDNEYNQLEKVKKEAPEIYHNFRMDEFQR